MFHMRGLFLSHVVGYAGFSLKCYSSDEELGTQRLCKDCLSEILDDNCIPRLSDLLYVGRRNISSLPSRGKFTRVQKILKDMFQTTGS